MEDSNRLILDIAIRRAVLFSLTGLLIIFLFTSNLSYVTPYAIAQETYPDSIFASTNQAQLHELVLKATQENGLTSTVAGFKVDLTNVVSAPANSELAIFTTDSALAINEAKVKTTTDAFIDLVKQSQNSFSLTSLPAGVYTLDVITQKGNARAAYEGILVLGQEPTNIQTRTIIEQQIVRENNDDDDGNNGDNGSNEKLDVSIAIGSNPIVRGNIQTISTTVKDSQSGTGISGTKIDGQVTYVTGHVERFSGSANGDGEYQHQWRISGNAKTGIFQVKVDASASGYGSASDSSSFRVVGASQAGLISRSDPCLDNSTLTECQPDPCLNNPTLPECQPDPCLNNPILPECQPDRCEVNPDAEGCQEPLPSIGPCEECQEDTADSSDGDDESDGDSSDNDSGDESDEGTDGGDDGNEDENGDGSNDEGDADNGDDNGGSGDGPVDFGPDGPTD
jgi:hypothetical protein